MKKRRLSKLEMSKNAHIRLAGANYAKGDTLKGRYHNEVIWRQKVDGRILSKNERKALFNSLKSK